MRHPIAATVVLAAAAGIGAELAAQPSAGPPPPEGAFRFEAVPRGQMVRIEASVADGFFLLRDGLRVATSTPGAVLGDVLKPAGETADDTARVPAGVYRRRVRLDVPVITLPPDRDALEIEVTSQGCPEAGECFAAQTRGFTVTFKSLVSPATPDSPAPAISALSRLASAFGGTEAGSEPQFLPVEQAFRPSASAAAGAVAVRFDIADGYYLYRERLGFVVRAPPGVDAAAPVLPAGKLKHDAYFGEQEVYYHAVTARLPLTGADARDGQALELVVRYQGCADAGLCYPPEERLLSVVLGPGTAAASPSVPPAVSETDQLARTLIRESLPWVLATFFFAGLLLAFTPCVLPMIPILSAIIAGQEGEPSGRRGFALSAVYVLAMSITYTAAGVVAASFGQNLQALFQHPAVLVGFSGLFVMLALAMFGVYELQLPVALQTRLASVSHARRGGGYLGVGAMGVLSALIVGPCVAAPLAAALIVIGSTGEPVRGGLALFALSIGMGVPLLAVGAFGPRLLPRAGPWMTLVKYAFGIMLLAVAVYLLGRLLPDSVTVGLWGGLALLASLLLARFALRTPGSTHRRLRTLSTGTAGVALLCAVVLGVGAATGARDPLQPFDGLRGAHSRELAFQRVKTVQELDAVLARANADGRTVMLDFYADWCVSCKQMERETFSAPAVQAALADAVLLQADVTAYDAADKQLLERFGLFGPPAILFFGVDGRERRDYRVIGFMSPTDFEPLVTRARRS